VGHFEHRNRPEGTEASQSAAAIDFPKYLTAVSTSAPSQLPKVNEAQADRIDCSEANASCRIASIARFKCRNCGKVPATTATLLVSNM